MDWSDAIAIGASLSAGALTLVVMYARVMRRLDDIYNLYSTEDYSMDSRLNRGETERNEIRERFSFHQATSATGPKHEEIRAKLLGVALWLQSDLPPSREKSLALTSLQETMMWANAAVAIHTDPEPLPPWLKDEA